MSFTLVELRQNIESILTNSDYLGNYTWNNGTVQAALTVLPDNVYGFNYPPEEVTVNKIEAVIIKPQIINKQLLGGDLQRKQTFKINLKQWEARDNDNKLTYPLRLREATQELYEELNHLLYDLTSPTYIPKNEKLGIIESSSFETYFYDICTD